MTAYLIVRAEVEPSARDGFDTWYQNEHLPDALKAFNAVSAKRGWSSVEPNVHIAFYEFPDLDAANALINSEIMVGFIKEFDRHWEGKVVRTRELVEFSQKI
ncbi:MAG: hypothetical protein HN478_01580 [Rhodospirillaceae bacterium]|jgi:hypothetical protein|nr:hypothetical protein [Rhodospirillaceae bacterium]MBT4486870.1 hypothetical protein [Rhodospirillaceae bacterium]MBT5050376.1 hypothetical protein [Rhodospirillaceae bacterium]MBT5459806.1 hypothetical protein [Rhodospirillaceae bacterium]MBT5899152.1 hypothetical protein [Rhodospirillaceae bacterium]